VPGENDRMKDTETRDRLLKKHDGVIAEHEALTRRWVAAKGSETEEGKAIKAERTQVMHRLKESYWEHDPYTRARSIMDREGVIKPNGTVDFYPSKEAAATAETNGKANGQSAPTVETTADDVD